MGRTRSVSEVGSRSGPETLYRLETDEIWEVVESNWNEVSVHLSFLSAKNINTSAVGSKQIRDDIYYM